MLERFGEALRKSRRNANRTLGDVAKRLAVSVVYVSDVERGNRKPFANDKILDVARFLEIDPTILLNAAAAERGFIEYDITKAKPLEAAVVSGLVSGLARGGVSEDQLKKINRILHKGEKANG